MCHRSHCSLFPSHEPFAQILPIYLNWFLPPRFGSNHPCQGRPVWWCPVAIVDAADDQCQRVPRIPPSKYVPVTHPSRVEGFGGTPNSRRSKTCRPQTASSQISDAHHLQSQWMLARTSRLGNGLHDPTGNGMVSKASPDPDHRKQRWGVCYWCKLQFHGELSPTQLAPSSSHTLFSLELISQIWQVFPTTLPTKASWMRWIAIQV